MSSTEKPKNEEIEIKDLLLPIINNWKRLLVIVIVSGLMGVVFFFLTEKYYIATSNFIPKIGDASSLSENIGGLAQIAGFDFSTPTEEISPLLYPSLIGNVVVSLELLKAPLALPTGEETTFEGYYNDFYSPSVLKVIREYTIGLPKKIIRLLPRQENDYGEEFIYLTTEQYDLIEVLRDQINIIPEREGGDVQIAVQMPDPYLAAQMAKHVEGALQNAIIEYKTKGIASEYEFLQWSYGEKKSDFEEAQDELAKFMDENQVITTSIAKNQLRRLESNLRVKEQIYNNIVLEKERTELDLNRNTPQFVVIKPIVIPYEKASPGILLFGVLFTALGFFVGSFWILIPSFKLFLGISLKE